MLDELNGLIDQNSRLVKEVDDLRLKLAHAEDGIQSTQQSQDKDGNDLKYSDQEL